MHWYYATRERQSVPVDEAALNDLVRAGVIRPDTLVWREGLDAWTPYSSVGGPLLPPPMPSVENGAGTGFCAECGRVFPPDQLVPLGPVTVCGICKPVYLQRIREGGRALGTVRYGGFWVRFVARLIDGMALGIAGWIIQIPLLFFIPTNVKPGQDPLTILPPMAGIFGVVLLLNLAMAVAYEAYFLSTRGATPGKMVFGLKVVRADGSGVSKGLAIGRYFAGHVSGMILGIGYIMAAFDDGNRALHDRICDTRVIHAS